ncbi:carboxypeptidase M32 [Lachnospiraceae bacterium OttesenSCG-928-D06]|nr:carboxypeptidase M32 [Lachnospiraceae bacterium OttesenSCG-928-D06]
MSKTVEDLKQYLDKLKKYEHVITLLYWDMKTVAPKKGMDELIDALTYFSAEQFELSTSDELFEILVELSLEEHYSKLNDTMKFVVSKMKEDMEKQRRIPKDRYEVYVKAQAEAGQAWEEAKEKSDFSHFAPHLEKMIELTKEMSSYTDPGVEVYEALLDQYEKSMDSATIDRLFEELKDGLKPLLHKILNAKQPDDSKFQKSFDIDGQKKVQDMLLDYMGFNKDAGAVGESAHPFTLNTTSKDVRVTNHYAEHNPINSIYSAIHEGGHGIFEQNVNPEYDNTVASSCRYMGIHESQSRFYENILGRNKNFWIPIYEKLQELLPGFQDITLDEFYKEVNHVRNSMIRIEADEVTYSYHIILRYEMEKAIFRDNVAVKDLPKLWNQKMEEYLHIIPENDSEGILQDMHWSDGSFGYFPSYLLGSIYDGMFLEQIEKELGNVDLILKEGRILEITKWLNKNIHQYGSTRTPKEVIANVCGKEVSAKALVNHFTKKYTEVYNL